MMSFDGSGNWGSFLARGAKTSIIHSESDFPNALAEFSVSAEITPGTRGMTLRQALYTL